MRKMAVALIANYGREGRFGTCVGFRRSAGEHAADRGANWESPRPLDGLQQRTFDFLMKLVLALKGF